MYREPFRFLDLAESEAKEDDERLQKVIQQAAEDRASVVVRLEAIQAVRVLLNGVRDAGTGIAGNEGSGSTSQQSGEAGKRMASGAGNDSSTPSSPRPESSDYDGKTCIDGIKLTQPCPACDMRASGIEGLED